MIGTDDIDKFIKSLIDIKPQSTYAISGSHEGLGLKTLLSLNISRKKIC